MALTILINSVDRTGEYRRKTLRLKLRLNGINTARFELIDKLTSQRPIEGESIEIRSDATVVFKGTVDTSDGEDFQVGSARPFDLGQSTNIYRVGCVDYNKLAERIIVAHNYEVANQTLKDIVVDLVDNQSIAGATLADEGVTTTGVETGPELGTVKFNYVTVQKCFDELAKKTGYLWNIDNDKVLQFFDRSSKAAPFSFGVGGVANYRKMESDKSRRGYRNVQVVRAGQQTTTTDQIETFKGDAENKTFQTRLPIANDETDKPVVEVDTGGGFVAKTVGVTEVDDDADFDWFWQRGQDRLTQQQTATALAATHVLRITYKGLFPIVIINEEETEILDRVAVEGGKGKYMHAIRREDLDDRDLAIEESEELLRRWGQIPETLTVSTDTFGMAEGHLVSCLNAALGVDGTFLVDAVTYKDLGDKNDTLRCTVKLIDGEHVGGWVEFFRRVLESGQDVTIRENEVLTLARKFSETITLSESLTDSSDTSDLSDAFTDPYTVATIGRTNLLDLFESSTQQDFLDGDTGDAELEHPFRWLSINRSNVTVMDADNGSASGTAGELHIENTDTEEPADWIDASRTGPFVYKRVFGDFDVWAEIEHDGDEDLLVGILCQSISTPGIWILNGMSEESGGSHFLVYRFNDDNPTSTNIRSGGGWGGSRDRVRMRRRENTFTLSFGFVDATGEVWTSESVQTLTTGDTVRLGIFASRESATGTLSARVDHFREFEPVAKAPVGFALLGPHPN